MLGAAAAGAAIGAAATIALHPSSGGGAAVRAYLLDHPEVIPEAMDRLQQKQGAAAIAANRAAIETPFAGAWSGAAHPKVVLTEFYDYACGYCRQTVADLDRLAAADPGLRIVYKQYPVLSQYSDLAGRMGFAAARQGKFAAFHHALFAAGPLSPETIAAAARTAHVDPAGAEAPDVAREVDDGAAAARALHVAGTPTFVVGNRLVAGAVGYDELKAAVDEAKRT